MLTLYYFGSTPRSSFFKVAKHSKRQKSNFSIRFDTLAEWLINDRRPVVGKGVFKRGGGRGIRPPVAHIFFEYNKLIY
jgi:hypothetical protein